MVLKHAILLTKAGIPLFSFDFREGKLHLDSILFSGLISALQTFVDDIIVPDKEAKVGFISSSNSDVLYCKGEQIITVLVGSELEKEFEERLVWITATVDHSINFDLFEINTDDDKAIEIGQNFKNHLITAFNSQSVQEYHTPIIVKSPEGVMNYVGQSPHVEYFTNFVKLANGKLTLFEIQEFIPASWTQLKMMTSELVMARQIVLKTVIHDEQIFRLTEKGMDMIFELEEIPDDLLPFWDTAITPFLSRVDSFRSYRELKSELEHELSDRDMYQLTTAIGQLLSKGIIQPRSSLFQLGIFLQKFYLNFYQYLIARVGHNGEQIFQEKINRNRYIKMILPDFVNQQISSIDKMYHLLKRSSFDVNKTIIGHAIVFIRDIIDALRGEVSDDIINDLEHRIWEETAQDNKLLIEKYQLNESFKTIIAN